MGQIWLIYGLYMGYLTECSRIAPLQGLYEKLQMYVFFYQLIL